MSLIPVTIFGAQLTAAEVLFVQNLAGLSYAQGDVLYYNSGNLTRLPIGTATQVLTVNAGATAPEWGSVAGSGTVTTVSVVTANGISGSVANATSTPAITLTLGAITPTSISMTSALTITPTSDVISGTFRRNGAGQTSNIIEIQTEVNALLASVDKTGKFTMPSLNISGLTASEIVITDASKNIVSAAVATYPSLTELTYLKGVTSAIQTQINAKGAGTVTSVGFTGGLISVATATTTPAFTVAGTSGGIPYFSSASTWATSAALAANALVVGGGAGVAPSTVTTGTGVLTALAVNVGSAGAFVTFNGALGTPSSGTVTNLTGTASININGTVGATTPTTIVATTIQANTGLVPDANDGAYLGTSALGFSDLFLASGAVINFNNGNATITHAAGSLTSNVPVTANSFIPSSSTAPSDGMYLPAANTIGFAISSTGEVQITASATSPVTSDGNALGTSSLMWSDLFLASGAVVNFNNGDVTITHASNLLTLAGGQFTFGANTAYFTETDNGNSSTADTIDWTLSNKQKSTLTGNCTFTFTAPGGPASLILKLVQDGTGSRTVTWPAAVHWSGGTAPTLTTTASKVDIICFYYDGSTYFGTSSLNYTA